MTETGVWGASDGWLRWTLAGLTVATFAQSLFLLIYASRPWWRDMVGRAYLVKSATLALILWLTMINTFYTYPGQRQVSLALTWLLAGAVIYQLTVLIRTPRRPPPPRRSSPQDETDDGLTLRGVEQ